MTESSKNSDTKVEAVIKDTKRSKKDKRKQEVDLESNVNLKKQKKHKEKSEQKKKGDKKVAAKNLTIRPCTSRSEACLESDSCLDDVRPTKVLQAEKEENPNKRTVTRDSREETTPRLGDIQPDSNLLRIYKIKRALHSMGQGPMDLSTYYTRTQIYWEQLSNIQSTSTTSTVEGLVAQREINRVIDFLIGLNDAYDHIRTQILMMKNLPTLSQVCNILGQERRSARAETSSLKRDKRKQEDALENHVNLKKQEEHREKSEKKNKDKKVDSFSDDVRLTKVLLARQRDNSSSAKETRNKEEQETYTCSYDTEDAEGDNQYTVSVKGFDSSLPRDDIKTALRDYFSSCGNITRVFVPIECQTGVRLGHAFINFKQGPEKALKLNQTEMGGRKLEVKLARQTGEYYGLVGFTGCRRCRLRSITRSVYPFRGFSAPCHYSMFHL